MRLIGDLTDEDRVGSERSRSILVKVRGIGKLTLFQNDGSNFNEWARKIEDEFSSSIRATRANV